MQAARVLALKRLEHEMKHTLSAGLVALAFASLTFGVAEAHPRLLSSSPAPNSRTSAPREVRLGFSETLIGKFSKIAVMDGKGHAVRVGPSALTPDHKQLVSPVLVKLSPGPYKVAWKAVSTDTHRVQGGYVFTVVK
jgi:methionine-rich copper-binding protein CopC